MAHCSAEMPLRDTSEGSFAGIVITAEDRAVAASEGVPNGDCLERQNGLRSEERECVRRAVGWLLEVRAPRVLMMSATGTVFSKLMEINRQRSDPQRMERKNAVGMDLLRFSMQGARR